MIKIELKRVFLVPRTMCVAYFSLTICHSTAEKRKNVIATEHSINLCRFFFHIRCPFVHVVQAIEMFSDGMLNWIVFFICPTLNPLKGTKMPSIGFFSLSHRIPIYFFHKSAKKNQRKFRIYIKFDIMSHWI